MRLAEASPVTGGLVFHILQGAPDQRRDSDAQRSANQTQVIRVGAMLVLLLIASRARPDCRCSARLRPALCITDVYATALAFMAPRTLEPVAVSQLTIWGLRGLDRAGSRPDGRAAGRQASCSRTGTGSSRRCRPPAEGDVNGWAGAATDLALAAAGTSRAACAGPEPRASCRASSTSCSTTSIRIPATCRRASAGEDRERRDRCRRAPDCVSRRRGAAIVVRGGDRGRPGGARRHPARRHDRRGGRPIRPRARTLPRCWLDRRAGRNPAHARLAWPRRAAAHGGADPRRGAARDGLRAARRRGAGAAGHRLQPQHRPRISRRRSSRRLAGPRPPEGIVLDLRGNRGGLLRQAVTRPTCCCRPAIVAITAGRDPQATRVWRSTPASSPRTCLSSCWSMAAPPAPPKSWPPRSPTAAAAWWSAAPPWARAWCRRSRRCRTAASCS